MNALSGIHNLQIKENPNTNKNENSINSTIQQIASKRTMSFDRCCHKFELWTQNIHKIFHILLWIFSGLFSFRSTEICKNYKTNMEGRKSVTLYVFLFSSEKRTRSPLFPCFQFLIFCFTISPNITISMNTFSTKIGFFKTNVFLFCHVFHLNQILSLTNKKFLGKQRISKTRWWK